MCLKLGDVERSGPELRRVLLRNPRAVNGVGWSDLDRGIVVDTDVQQQAGVGDA
jgi:hypothetical protein